MATIQEAFYWHWPKAFAHFVFVSHFFNSHNISNIFIIRTFVIVIYNQ